MANEQPNPYVPPNVTNPPVPAQRAKRGFAFMLALVLTPVATFIAFFATCSYNVILVQRWPPANRPLIPLYLPPLIVFCVMAALTLVVCLSQKRRS